MPTRRAGLALTGALALLPIAACDEGGASSSADASLRVQPLATPAGAGSAQPSLAVSPDGRVYLSWHEPTADSNAVLRLAVLEDTSWSTPMTVARDRPFIVNWADFPSVVALGGDRLAAHWLEREGSDRYAYGVRVAFSDDGGATWSEPVRPHTDSTETEHGFVSMLPAGEGVDAVWLDGRLYETAQEQMTLRSARVTADGLAHEVVLDDRICDCCQTDAARTASGDVVVYRDRSADEIRDIAIVRRVDGRWSEPAIVHADGWHIEGCPVNGPAVAAQGDALAVAWFTGARDSAKVQLAFSSDGGATFGPPVRIDEGRPGGRVDVAMLDRETAMVSWIEEGEPAAALRVRTVRSGAAAGAATTVGSIAAARASGFPHMAVAGDAVVIAWTDVDARTVRIARIAR